VLLAVMAAHPDAKDLQLKTCFALSKLAWQHEENKRRCLELRAPVMLARVRTISSLSYYDRMVFRPLLIPAMDSRLLWASVARRCYQVMYLMYFP
jgi:hypothetical protein